MSLDRIDNSRGYYDANVQLVTQIANRARGKMSPQEARAGSRSMRSLDRLPI